METLALSSRFFPSLSSGLLHHRPGRAPAFPANSSLRFSPGGHPQSSPLKSLKKPSPSSDSSKCHSSAVSSPAAAASIAERDEKAKFMEASKAGNLVPLFRCIFSDHLTPVLAYRCLVKEDDREAPSFLFESVEQGSHGTNVGRYSFVGAQPAMEIVAKGNSVSIMDHEEGHRTKEIVDDPMQIPRGITEGWSPQCLDELPDVFCGGWIGYFSYDTVRYVEKKKLPFSSAPEDDRNLPDVHLGLYNNVIVFDHVEKKAYVIHWVRLDRFSSVEDAYQDGRKRLERLLAIVHNVALTDLRLYNNELSGPLPPELGKHCPLWNLEVDDNQLSGELPENLCAQGELASIVVFDNNFTGNIPRSLGECAPLDNLQFQNNGFSGDFPAGIWSAVNLSTVILRGNNLTGTLPDRLPWNLTRLDIQNNRFSGKIPTVAGSLLVFLAGNNMFSGEIPASLTGISNLLSWSLGGNMLTGPIPDGISTLRSLTDLNLSSNQLVGFIPASIGTLPVLTSLDLSNNQLVGEIPPALGNLHLYFLNLSSNHLSGEVPFAWQNPAYDRSFESNPALCASDPALSVSRCGYRPDGGSSALSAGVKTMIIVLGALFFLVAAVFAVFVARDFKRRKDGLDPASWKLTSFHALSFNESSVVKSLTEGNLIGDGGSGRVYRVEIRNRAADVVAVKKIWSRSKVDSRLEREFASEVQILSSIRHTNIVKLLCCISSADSKLLVYEYMKNGSLDRWLHEARRAGGPPLIRSGSGHAVPLDWPRRLGIAIGAARGLCYMHHDCSPPIVHRDVKSSNILLDSEFRARIADFGLARMLAKAGEPSSVTAVAGSFGYMAPECAYTQKVNEKMDVYSFGVVLLELTTGREASAGGEQGGLADWAWHHFQIGNKVMDVIDETIRDPACLDEIAKVLKLGLICTGTLPSTRPTMKEVVEILLRCDHTAWNSVKPQVERDGAPLLQLAGGSRHKSDSSTGEDGDDCVGLACNV